MHQKIIILDFGSQYTQLIARRIRESGVYSEIHPCTIPPEEVQAMEPEGLILSGGPCSVYDDGAPALDDSYLGMTRKDGRPMPVLGICYGVQAMAYNLGGSVKRAERREFGRASLIVDDDSDLLAGIPTGTTVWMSHGDHITRLPDDFRVIAHTANAPVAAVRRDNAPTSACSFIPRSYIRISDAWCSRTSLTVSVAAEATGRQPPSSKRRSRRSGDRRRRTRHSRSFRRCRLLGRSGAAAPGNWRSPYVHFCEQRRPAKR
jgi:GMP synthase (glutamine-hydrolysing) A subunit